MKPFLAIFLALTIMLIPASLTKNDKNSGIITPMSDDDGWVCIELMHA